MKTAGFRLHSGLASTDLLLKLFHRNGASLYQTGLSVYSDPSNEIRMYVYFEIIDNGSRYVKLLPLTLFLPLKNGRTSL